jgi:CRISPR-associated protein Csh1
LKSDLDNYENELNKITEQIKGYKTIYIFIDLPIEKYKSAWENFSKNPNSIDNNNLGNNYLQSDELINFDISRKPFMAHYTATFFYNYKTKSEDQEFIKKFFKELKSKDIFPKPLPIFIDKKELNYKVVSIYQANKDKMSYSDIFEEIYNTDKGIEMNDLQNYYLLYVNNNQRKIEIKDFEFVPSFNYKFECSIFPIFETESEIASIKNIFDFQRIIVRELFDNSLIKIDEKGKYTQNYWGTVESKYYKSQNNYRLKSQNNYRLILQYRKSFYDFIYKSKKQSIKPRILRDIVLSSIIDTLQDEKYRTTNKSKEERIMITSAKSYRCVG